MLRRCAAGRPGRLLQLSDRRALVGGLAITQTVGWGVLHYGFSPLLVSMEDDLGWARSTFVAGFTLAVVLSALLAPAVGRVLDRYSPRGPMAAGSALGAVAVLGWSQVRSPAAYLACWAVIGVAMSLVLYEAAFTVIAKRCAPRHRRAITTVTLVAGLASLVFQPIAGWLTEAHGWRATLVVLALVLAVTTVPLHLVVLGGPDGRPVVDGDQPPVRADRRFWVLTAAFSAVSIAGSAVGVLLIAHLVDEGWSLGRAAVAGGTLGAMQLPGRLAFGPAAARLPERVLAPLLMSMPGIGILVLVAVGTTWPVWGAIAILGFGQGATTLLRSMVLIDLYGVASIGRLSGLSAVPITLARALAPLVAAALAPVVGFDLVLGALVLCSVAAAGGSWAALRTVPTPPVHLDVVAAVG